MRQALGLRATAVRSQTYYLDVTHKGANKGTVVVTGGYVGSARSGATTTMGRESSRAPKSNVARDAVSARW